jgi:hypothetical protein
MTREEAIEDLITLKRRGITEDMDTSIDTAIAALRSGWVRTVDRVPDVGLVAAIEKVVSGLDNHDTLVYPVITYAVLVREEPEAFVYWYALPKLPEVDKCQ